MKATRLHDRPLIVPGMDKRIGANINGPSVIRVPEWVTNPLGRYYLYFAHHQGDFIRLAYSHHLDGPYEIYSPGVMELSATPFSQHIASPDVHVDSVNRRIVMLYHGAGYRFKNPTPHVQVTCFAESKDGLTFRSAQECLGESYLRVFCRESQVYGLAGGPHRLWNRSSAWNITFEEGPRLDIAGEDFTDCGSPAVPYVPIPGVRRMRHVCFHRDGDTLWIYYSNIGDCPERIKRTSIDLKADWTKWRGTAFEEVLRSEMDYEGASEAFEPSRPSSAHHPVHELRDPYVFEEGGRTYLFYTVAGEQGIGLAEIE